MSENKLGKTLWDIANNLRGAMMADDFRDYMLSFLFWKYLSENYIKAAQRELGSDWESLDFWYKHNPDDIFLFEKQMRRKIHYVIEPKYLWDNIVDLAKTQSNDLLKVLEEGFKYIETESLYVEDICKASAAPVK